jgi:hypothetical protein
MGFVVKVTDGRSAFQSWLGPPYEGERTLAPREMVDVFQRPEDAHAAIAAMPRTFTDTGWVSSIEPAH